MLFSLENTDPCILQMEILFYGYLGCRKSFQKICLPKICKTRSLRKASFCIVGKRCMNAFNRHFPLIVEIVVEEFPKKMVFQAKIVEVKFPLFFAILEAQFAYMCNPISHVHNTYIIGYIFKVFLQQRLDLNVQIGVQILI